MADFSFAANRDGDAGGGVLETFSLFNRKCNMVRRVMRTAKADRIIGIR
jgi:hypothetical protein